MFSLTKKLLYKYLASRGLNTSFDTRHNGFSVLIHTGHKYFILAIGEWRVLREMAEFNVASMYLAIRGDLRNVLRDQPNRIKCT
jgi:hypothetical protein